MRMSFGLLVSEWVMEKQCLSSSYEFVAAEFNKRVGDVVFGVHPTSEENSVGWRDFNYLRRSATSCFDLG